MLHFEHVRWNNHNNVEFSTSGNDDVSYQFKGEVREMDLRGQLKKVTRAPSKIEKEFQVQATLVEGSLSKLRPVERFSNVEFVEDAGDLVGAELILASGNGRYRGIVTFYTGYWGETPYIPMFLNDVKRIDPNNSKIKFNLHFGGDSKSYSVIVYRDRVALEPALPPAGSMALSLTLPRTSIIFHRLALALP